MAQKYLHRLSSSIQAKSSDNNCRLKVLPTPQTRADIASLEAQLRECDQILIAQDKDLWRFRQQIRERDEAILALIKLVESGMGGALDPLVVQWRRRLTQS